MTIGPPCAEQAARFAVPPGWPPAEELAARAHLYRLFAGVFLEEPGPAFIEALRAPGALAELSEAGVRFDVDFLEPPLPSLLDALSVEYASLFFAAGGLPPVESVRLTGHLQQQPCMAARAFYRRLGFTLGRGRFHVHEDQLGVELLFVAELLDRMRCALEGGEAAGARQLDKEVKRFWSQHLGRWVRGFARLVARAAEHSYYRQMAGFLERFAAEELEAMRLRIADEDRARLVVPKRVPALERGRDEPVCNACGKRGRLADLEIGHG